ncbi:RNA polymerase sigma-70 factor [Aquimarina sp. RZ0]|uniref:RNA polymerase sigma-70 factor n=1 Tax=Aquimarina sp. RZ0 TaxID=2607730 RepID=UPI00165ECC15|nr:RNA polymerase sigma-70 factor [Aquimarina sp. RZ0]
MSNIFFIDELKADNNQALESLFKKYYKVLVIFSNNYIHDRAIAEDLVQDVFVMIFEKRETLKIHTSIKSFLYTSVRNHTLNYIKKSKSLVHHQHILNDIDAMDTDVSEMIDLAELSEKLYKAIDKLPSQNQKIFRMSKLDGYSNQEIADQLGLTKRTVETHISNALKKLKELVKKNNLIFFYFFYVFLFFCCHSVK